MAKTKSKVVEARSGPSVEALQQLAKRLREQKEQNQKDSIVAKVAKEKQDQKAAKGTSEASGGKSSSSKDPMPSASVEPETKRRRVTGKKPDLVEKEDITEKVDYWDNFNPACLDFQLKWCNYDKLKKKLKLNDADTTAILVAMVGPSPEGKQYWDRYRVESPKPTPAEPEKVEEKAKPAKLSKLKSQTDLEDPKPVANATNYKNTENANELDKSDKKNKKELKSFKEHYLEVEMEEEMEKYVKAEKEKEKIRENEGAKYPTKKKRKIVKRHPDTQPGSDYETEYMYEGPEEEEVDLTEDTLNYNPDTDIDQDDEEDDNEDGDDADDEDGIKSTCNSSHGSDAPPPAPPRASAVAQPELNQDLKTTQVITGEPAKQPIDEDALEAKLALKEALKTTPTPVKATAVTSLYLATFYLN